jgi:hypothetical protein
MWELVKKLTGIDCKREESHPLRARICVLEVFIRKRSPCLTREDILSEYRRGGKGHLSKVLKHLEEIGILKREGLYYCLTLGGLAITQADPPCPTLYLAGADRALQVAVQSGIRPLNWLLSAGRYWNGGRFRHSEDFKMARSLGGLLFLDSGAQQFYAKFKGGEYPYTPAQYLDFAVNVVGADLIATLDLPLDILTPRGLPVAEGIRKTVEYGVEVAALAEKLGVLEKIVPVLQGFDDPSQWLESLDLYKQHGVTPQRFKLWGVGSICMMRSPKLVERVLSAVRKALGDAKMHVFGISLNALRRVFPLIDSYDTSAWVYWAKKDGAVLVWSRRRRAFIHLQARDGRRYTTEDLLEANLRQILNMHEDLCYQSVQTTNH